MHNPAFATACTIANITGARYYSLHITTQKLVQLQADVQPAPGDLQCAAPNHESTIAAATFHFDCSIWAISCSASLESSAKRIPTRAELLMNFSQQDWTHCREKLS